MGTFVESTEKIILSSIIGDVLKIIGHCLIPVDPWFLASMIAVTPGWNTYLEGWIGNINIIILDKYFIVTLLLRHIHNWTASIPIVLALKLKLLMIQFWFGFVIMPVCLHPYYINLDSWITLIFICVYHEFKSHILPELFYCLG